MFFIHVKLLAGLYRNLQYHAIKVANKMESSETTRLPEEPPTLGNNHSNSTIYITKFCAVSLTVKMAGHVRIRGYSEKGNNVSIMQI
jgi:hypothetical protein